MKLSDFGRVGALRAELNYLRQLHAGADCLSWRIDKLHLRPDLTRALVPHARQIISTAIVKVIDELAELGVTPDEGDLL